MLCRIKVLSLSAVMVGAEEELEETAVSVNKLSNIEVESCSSSLFIPLLSIIND